MLSDDQAMYTGSADALKRAMNAARLDEMLDCFQSLKAHSITIEKDLRSYVNELEGQTVAETNAPADHSVDFIQQAKDSTRDGRYILLRELMEGEKVYLIGNIQSKSSFFRSQKVNRPPVTVRRSTHENVLLEQQTKSMKRVIAAQPSALEAIYLEALLNPDHDVRQTPPLDPLTKEERQRLRHLLHQRQ